VDLLVSYSVTALFGVAMVIIGAHLSLADEKGTGLIVRVADRLGEAIGRPMRWVFLIGAWATIFDSLLGVWQAVPYLFCDFWQLSRRDRGGRGFEVVGVEYPTPAEQPVREAVDTRSPIYRGYLLALATLPMIGLWSSFVYVQKAYSLLGAIVMPLLAAALLVLNGRSDWVGRAYRNRPLTVAVLVAILLFFIYAAYVTIVTKKDIVS
jgi:hypothetical protein